MKTHIPWWLNMRAVGNVVLLKTLPINYYICTKCERNEGVEAKTTQEIWRSAFIRRGGGRKRSERQGRREGSILDHWPSNPLKGTPSCIIIWINDYELQAPYKGERSICFAQILNWQLTWVVFRSDRSLGLFCSGFSRKRVILTRDWNSRKGLHYYPIITLFSLFLRKT